MAGITDHGAAALGRVLDLPMHLVDEPAGMVDDWGRDAGLVRSILGLAQLRWNVTVGGDQHLPRRKGALIVVNARRFALAPIFSALAISEAVDRPVRFVGRSDVAPLGPLARRIGGLLDHPDELFGALRAGELVVMGAEATTGLRDVGRVRHDLVGAATAAGVQAFPAATTSTPARPQRPRRDRSGDTPDPSTSGAPRRTRTRRPPPQSHRAAPRRDGRDPHRHPARLVPVERDRRCTR